MNSIEALREAMGFVFTGLVFAAPIAVFVPRFNLYGYNGAAVLSIAALLISPFAVRKWLKSRYASYSEPPEGHNG